jgi:sulfoxide reductase catalytic subunit YedY
MPNKFAAAIPPSEVTPRAVWRARRELLRGAAGLAAIASLPRSIAAAEMAPATGAAKLATVPSALSVMENPTSYKDVTGYNNYYEYGTAKSDPARNAPQRLHPRPWTLRVEGAVRRPRTFDVDELLKLAPLEERVYRLRCVEAWSAVVPWVGYSLSELLKRVEPTGSAKFVEFTTLADPAQMPGLSYRVLDWPYTEGLRLDEAMHPLTLLGLGLYGEVLPAQNGAPVRVVVPWKYGFKSAKSLVRIRLVEQQPATSWNRAAPDEYGFYSNVNPSVDHPRWSQASERRLGDDGLFAKRRPTLMFNGYGDQVASLYAGMDLKKYF